MEPTERAWSLKAPLDVEGEGDGKGCKVVRRVRYWSCPPPGTFCHRSLLLGSTRMGLLAWLALSEKEKRILLVRARFVKHQRKSVRGHSSPFHLVVEVQDAPVVELVHGVSFPPRQNLRQKAFCVHKQRRGRGGQGLA